MKPVPTSKASSSPASFAFTAEQIAFALQNAEVNDVPDDSSMNSHAFLGDNNLQNAIVSYSLPELRAKLAQKQAIIGRPKSMKPKKMPTTIRLSPEVILAFKATGAGWQARIDAALKDWLRTHSPGV